MIRWLVFGVFITLAGCAGLQVSRDYDPGFDFSALQTYRWLPAPRIKSGDPEIQYDSLMEARVRHAVDEQLALRGYRQVESEADFLVAYHAAVENKLSVTYIQRVYGYAPLWDEHPYNFHHGYAVQDAIVDEYQQGTLILDIVEPDSKRLIWRGSASEEIYPRDTPARREARVREAVKQILEPFPP